MAAVGAPPGRHALDGAASDSDAVFLGGSQPNNQSFTFRNRKLLAVAAAATLALGATVSLASRPTVSAVPAGAAPAAAPALWQAVPTTRCAAKWENCNTTRCCLTPGTQCYQKDAEYAMCWPFCSKGPWPIDVDHRPWSCKELGPRRSGIPPRDYFAEPAKNWTATRCSGAKESCGLTRCCSEPGQACYVQSKSLAACTYGCPPGKWDCPQLGGLTPGSGEKEWTKIPKTRCADKWENCNTTKCCRTPGTQCYKKDDKYAMCWPECISGRNPIDLTPAKWNCSKLGPRLPGQAPESYGHEKVHPWVAKVCAKSGSNCSKPGCCRDAGLACYQKNASWAGCLPTCVAGSAQPYDTDDSPWNCTQVSMRTPGTFLGQAPAKWVLDKCAGPDENCANSKCCKDKGYACRKKNASFAKCLAWGCDPGHPLLADWDGPQPWDCSVLGAPMPAPKGTPWVHLTRAPWAQWHCSPVGKSCKESRCCQDRRKTCFEKNPGWAQCMTWCDAGVHVGDWSPTPWSCRVLGPIMSEPGWGPGYEEAHLTP